MQCPICGAEPVKITGGSNGLISYKCPFCCEEWKTESAERIALREVAAAEVAWG